MAHNLQYYINEIKQLDHHNIGSWPNWAYKGSFVLIFLIFFFIGFHYFLIPQKNDYTQLTHKETKLKHKYKKKWQIASHLHQYKTQVKKAQKQFKTLLKKLPTQSEVPGLLNDISKTRSSNHLNQQMFKPLANQHHKFYTKLPNILVVTGNYHDMAHFISDVASLPRIVTISNVHIKINNNKPNQNSKNSSNYLYMSLNADTYKYNKGSETNKSNNNQ